MQFSTLLLASAAALLSLHSVSASDWSVSPREVTTKGVPVVIEILSTNLEAIMENASRPGWFSAYIQWGRLSLPYVDTPSREKKQAIDCFNSHYRGGSRYDDLSRCNGKLGYSPYFIFNLLNDYLLGFFPRVGDEKCMGEFVIHLERLTTLSREYFMGPKSSLLPYQKAGITRLLSLIDKIQAYVKPNESTTTLAAFLSAFFSTINRQNMLYVPVKFQLLMNLIEDKSYMEHSGRGQNGQEVRLDAVQQLKGTGGVMGGTSSHLLTCKCQSVRLPDDD